MFEKGSYEDKKLRADYGMKLFDRYMDILDSPDVWTQTATCYKHSTRANPQAMRA